MQRADKPLKNLAAMVENEFCAVILVSLDDKPIAQADRLLLVATARAANTGMKWNDKRTSLTDWGTEPSVIEPVKGFVTLKGLDSAGPIEAMPLDSGAKPIGKSIPAVKTTDGYRLRLGEPATPWYLVRIMHDSATSEEATMRRTPATEQMWVKCARCGQSYQTDMKRYYRELEEKRKADPSWRAIDPPLKCERCGQDGIRKALKCDQCGNVFGVGSVPNDFVDRCPTCRYSKTEAIRKARTSGDW